MSSSPAFAATARRRYPRLSLSGFGKIQQTRNEVRVKYCCSRSAETPLCRRHLQWLWNYWHKLCSLPLSLVGKAEQASSASWMQRCYFHNHEDLLRKPEYLKTQGHRSQHTQWPAMSPLVIRGVITAAGTCLLHFGHRSHACKRKCCHKQHFYTYFNTGKFLIKPISPNHTSAVRRNRILERKYHWIIIAKLLNSASFAKSIWIVRRPIFKKKKKIRGEYRLKFCGGHAKTHAVQYTAQKASVQRFYYDKGRKAAGWHKQWASSYNGQQHVTPSA